uniref:ATP synthase F0 subunit 8 n=1 Tax=Craspedacusta sowerbii TaxID=128124 RepID=J7ETV9_CRASO|nr:ATP synthase F0 subunit 8 [Craspedacusta sowerbii]AEO93242.1 ATP synthase F0 subunit 8 [Craspedacusta sowerbii]QXT43882.1 ATP synthase F0 subunit 8 [Craspedacusta sowerbii]QXT43897.1 ATP synthase F0 subunit 8 [Craspedacusta sowerbii]QZN08022.1 ATP synthase F0 subunit 8 [Craspedacusta sowerbii]CUS58527.1 TPA: ATP synthase F0 subunit 8 [Craspedacusta sowerbii]
MPQLDTVTFLSQYLWTLLSLFSMFVFVVIFLMPQIKANFKIRSLSEKDRSDRGLDNKDTTLLKKILQL